MRLRLKTICVLLTVMVSLRAAGQATQPAPATTTTKPQQSVFDNLFNFGTTTDTPRTQVPVTNVPQTGNTGDTQDGGKPKQNKYEQDEDVIKKLQLEKQRIQLEKELDELKNPADHHLTKQDSVNIQLKSENLSIVLQKERVLLEKELQLTRLENQNGGGSPIYGHNFFRNSNIKFFSKVTDVMSDPAYVIGAGDRINIAIWGNASFNQDVEVDEQGYVDIPRLVRVNLKGQTLRNAKKILKDRFSSVVSMNGSQFEVSVIGVRKINVNVIGEVNNPGTYSILASNSVFNLLAHVGGPTDIGSVRSIYIKREGKVADSLDIYEYMSNPKNSRDIYLQDNDYVVVPPIGKVVRIEGGVKRPGYYEMKGSEKLRDLFRYASGFYPTTYLKDIIVERIENNEYYKTFSINYDSLSRNKKDMSLQDADIITLKNIADNDNVLVSVLGPVNIPGSYMIQDGEPVSTLIKRANGLLEYAYMDKAYIYRTNPDFSKTLILFNLGEAMKNNPAENIKLKFKDQLIVLDRKSYIRQYNVVIEGGVRQPGSFDYGTGIRLLDLIQLAGGLRETAITDRAIRIQTDEYGISTQSTFSLKDALERPLSEANFVLDKRDRIIVFDTMVYLDKYNVSITGNVRKPGTFPYAENFTIRDLIELAGGLRETAISTRGLWIKTNADGTTSQIALNIPEAMNDATAQNFILDKRDNVIIYDTVTFIDKFTLSILGEVKNPGTFPYASNFTLKDLIYQSGGFTFEAENAIIEVVRFIGDDPTSNMKIPMPTQLMRVGVLRNFTLDEPSGRFVLQPKDQVFVRRNPNARPVQMVSLTGEVVYPGNYVIVSDKEKVSDLIKRAGGLKPTAFAYGTEFLRTINDSIPSKVIINLKKAMHRKHSRYNYLLVNGDKINVPKMIELVTIDGAVRLDVKDTKISVYHRPGKRARYYIRHFAGGFTKTADRKRTIVTYANGSRKSAKNYVLFKIYPKVKIGSHIQVPESIAKKAPKTKFSLDEVLAKTTQRVLSILSLIAIFKVATH